jgi:hypothetical protein
MNRFWLSQGAHTAWDSSAETPHTSLEILLNKNILGLQLFQDWDVYTGRSYYEAYASGPLISWKQLF